MSEITENLLEYSILANDVFSLEDDVLEKGAVDRKRVVSIMSGINQFHMKMNSEGQRQYAQLIGVLEDRMNGIINKYVEESDKNRLAS